MIHLVLGGARSGKSRFAEQQTLALAQLNQNQASYIATATPIDGEMSERISKHQADRGNTWHLIECPLMLSDMLSELPLGKVYLVDCLTLWLNNQLFSVEGKTKHDQSQHLNDAIKVLVSSLSKLKSDIFIVSNEIGLGVIPMGETTRLYVDYCGWLNQAVAEIADKVTLVTAGIPLTIKPQ